MLRWLLLSSLLLVATSAAAETVTGRARVLDGDTLVIRDRKVRLHGIDAPEGAQSCKGASGKTYPCGDVATRRLHELSDNRVVVCTGSEQDRYERLIAVCSVSGQEINRTLVREGIAWAFVRYSRDYVPEEQEARSAKRGVFAAENLAPWDLRDGKWGEAERMLLKEGCVIKGNVNGKGERIYHMPWQRDYAKVSMGKGTGERWFCDQGEAEKAGWRPAFR